MLTRWLTWIKLFNFKIRHVKGATHTAADFLFKKPKHLKNTKPNTAEENNNENWIFAKLEAYELYLIKAIKEKENEASTNLKLERRSDILREMKKQIQKLREDEKISISSLNMESNKRNL